MCYTEGMNMIRILISAVLFLLGASELSDLYFCKKAIKSASAEYGLPYDLMSKIAYIESSFNPKAETKSTSARGLFQITKDTEEEIYRLCSIKGDIFDEWTNARMASCYMKTNYKKLRKLLKREPTQTELYLTHFLGYRGSLGIILAKGDIIDYKRYKTQIKANPSIFLKDDETVRSVTELKQFLRDKIRNARVL